jgi:hypothetical protein
MMVVAFYEMVEEGFYLVFVLEHWFVEKIVGF